jgi:hypothetical protein
MYVINFERLINGRISRFGTRGSSRRREKAMKKTCSSKRNIPLVVSMDLNLHIKYCSSQIKKIEKESYVDQYQGFKVYQK